MRIVITGGMGLVGTPITQKFVANDWDVKVIDLASDTTMEGITYVQCDILDYDAVFEQIQGYDAIVHLAAIPSTRHKPSHELFHINVTGTANVYEASANAGIKRVVQASSINAIGSYWGCDDRQFDYFPLDENHSMYTTDPYSFSKQMVEEVADYYWRRDGISGVSFRFPAVWSDETLKTRNIHENLATKRQQLDAFLQLPETERRQQLAKARESVLDFRSKRLYEYDAVVADLDKEQGQYDDWLWSSYFFDRYNYWSYIHTVDSTQAVEKAILGDYEGSHPLFVNSDVNYLNYDSETLLQTFFPTVTKRSKPIHEADALISNDKAHDLIGYQPTYRFAES